MRKVLLKAPYLRSSADPTKISLTIEGVIGLLASIVIPLAIYSGADLTGIDLEGLVSQLITLAQQISAVASSVVIVAGVIRRIYLQNKK